MLSDNRSDPGMNTTEPPPDVDLIDAAQAEAILKATIEPYLAEGWHLLHEDAYSARLTHGMRNLDVRVDLLGEVTVEETELTPLQESGRLMAWMILMAMLLVAMALFSALGIL